MNNIFGNTEDDLPKNSEKRVIPKNKMRKVVVEPQKHINVEELATNVVDFSDEDINKFKSSVEDLTKSYIDILKDKILPHVLALDSAMEYVRALASDGIGRKDVASDNSLQVAQSWVLLDVFISELHKKLGVDSNPYIKEELAKLMSSELANKGSSISDSSTVGIVKSNTSIKKNAKTS